MMLQLGSEDNLEGSALQRHRYGESTEDTGHGRKFLSPLSHLTSPGLKFFLTLKEKPVLLPTRLFHPATGGRGSY